MRQIFKEYYVKNKPAFTPVDLVSGRKEVKITAELARILNARAEYVAGYGLGRIDVISTNWLIEAKYCDNSLAYKNALGQLLLYAFAQNWQANLGLAAIGSKEVPPGIRLFCQKNHITIFTYNPVNSCRWRISDYNVKRALN